MDLYQLRYFLETARELSFTRAADNLHVSPSAVSRSVGLLERSVGKSLFTRTKRTVVLTAAGESLKTRAESIFDQVESARAELAGAARAPETLRLGSREMITNYLLPGPLKTYREKVGATRFEIYELDPAAMAAAVKKDQLDLGFYYADLEDAALETSLLGRLRSHVYASRGYLKKNPRAQHPFIAPRAFGADPSLPRADGYPDRRSPRDIRYEADSLEAHRRFVLAGLCVGVLPDIVMDAERRRGKVVVLESPPIHRSIYCFRRKGRALPKAADAFIASVRAVVREFVE